jgi:hypothetical protein
MTLGGLNLRGGERRGGTGGGGNGTNGLVGVHQMVGRRVGDEGTACDQFLEPTLAARTCQDGDPAGVCVESGQKRLLNELGRKVRISAFLSTPSNGE